MVSSSAKTVEAYLSELPEERRKIISQMRVFILKHLPDGYEETMNWGMISYEIPLSTYPKTYNKKPLLYLALAAQKNFNSLYLMNIYQDSKQLEFLMKAFADSDLKPDMGKSCLHFNKLEDLPLDDIGAIIGSMPPAFFIAVFEQARSK